MSTRIGQKEKTKTKKGGQACLRSFVGGQIKKHLGYINDMGDLLYIKRAGNNGSYL